MYMDDLWFVLSTVTVISGQWESDNERMCAMEPHLQLEMIYLPSRS